MWLQKTFSLKPRSRGFHLVDNDINAQLPEISRYRIGILHLFIQHTSASLTINENADPTVRMDMESHFNKFVPERQSYYKHDYEGDDDVLATIEGDDDFYQVQFGNMISSRPGDLNGDGMMDWVVSDWAWLGSGGTQDNLGAIYISYNTGQ